MTATYSWRGSAGRHGDWLTPAQLNRALDEADRRWYPVLLPVTADTFETFDRSVTGWPVVYDPQGRLWPTPSPEADPYVWR